LRRRMKCEMECGSSLAYDRLSHTDFLWTVYTALEQMQEQPLVTPGGK
jgi:hypothetical protein